MRIHELAKKLDLSSKDLIAKMGPLGIEAKSHMSAVSEPDVEKVLQALAPAEADATPAETAAKTAEAEVAAPAAVATAVEVEITPEPQAVEEPAAAEDPSDPVETVEEPAPEEEVDDKNIIVKGPIVVRDFAEMLHMKPNQVIAELMAMNVFASISEKVDIKIAQQLATKHGYTLEQEKRQPERKPAPPVKKEEVKEPEVDKPDQLQLRPPIITFMGHVDHGKTSLLDYIRKSKVVAGEHGGITQHIGAYSVEHNGQKISFLDTPGHAAFTAMRARGANLTDIVVIVIAADDGLMPQTREAIQHALAANVAIVVAINKTDLPAANVDRVKQQLQAENLSPEDWGGDTICVPVSAETGAGVDELIEMLLLQAEVLELKANPDRKSQGYVIEARLEPGRGPTANLLVRRGTLNVGDSIVCGPFAGRVKALIDDRGKKIKSAGPSMPVMCLGLADVPEAGAEFEVYPNTRLAKTESDKRIAALREKSLEGPGRKASLDDLLNQTNPDETEELAVIIKADVQGSIEALIQSLGEIKSEKVDLKIVMSGVGNVTTNDVLLASASNAIILGFHVALDGSAASLGKREGVEIRLYQIIYELVDEVRDAMTGLLAPDEKERVVGQAQIRQVFELSNRNRVAGCMITKGRISSRARARVRRGSDVLYEGRLETLKRFQNDAREVREGQECGLRLDGFSKFEVGDIVETYEIEQLAAQL